MKLTLEQVEHVAELAKLSLSESEKEDSRQKLSSILGYAEMLQQVDTDAVPPTSSVLPLHNVMREDEIIPSMPREDVLSNAPDVQDDCFRVRAILG